MTVEYALVFLSALIVGAIVYWVTVRQEQAEPADEVDYAVPTEATPPASSPGTIYIPLTPATTTGETRVSGVVGIVVIVMLSAAALALALYLGGAFIVNLFGDVASNGGVTGP
jgi:hypothetical protein